MHRTHSLFQTLPFATSTSTTGCDGRLWVSLDSITWAAIPWCSHSIKVASFTFHSACGGKRNHWVSQIGPRVTQIREAYAWIETARRRRAWDSWRRRAWVRTKAHTTPQLYTLPQFPLQVIVTQWCLSGSRKQYSHVTFHQKSNVGYCPRVDARTLKYSQTSQRFCDKK